MTTPNENLYDRVLREVPDAAETAVGKRILKQLKENPDAIPADKVEPVLKGLREAIAREVNTSAEEPVSGGKQVKKKADLDALDGNTGNDTTTDEFNEKFNKGWKNAR